MVHQTHTISDLQRRVEDLPLGLSAFGRYLLTRPGLTPDHLLWWAEGCDEAAGECGTLIRPAPEQDGWAMLAGILRDACRSPLAAHPPREPLAAMAAEAAIRARASAAGLSTACIHAQDRVDSYPDDWDLRGERFIGGEP